MNNGNDKNGSKPRNPTAGHVYWNHLRARAKLESRPPGPTWGALTAAYRREIEAEASAMAAAERIGK